MASNLLLESGDNLLLEGGDSLLLEQDIAIVHTRQAPVVIQSSAITGGPHSNFPVLLTVDNLPSLMFDADGAAPAQADGGDIRFFSDENGTTPIPCEIVSFSTNNNPALGSAVIWVKPASVTSSADTTIYVRWNTSTTDSQPATSAAAGRNAVWSAYEMVLHLTESGDGTTGEYTDSTGNGYDATGGNGTASYVPSAVTTNHPWGDTWQQFDGADDRILIENSGNALDSSYISLSVWLWQINASVNDGVLTNRFAAGTAGNNYFMYYPQSGIGRWSGALHDGTGENLPAGTDPTNDTGVVQHRGYASAAGYVRLFKDGAQIQTDTSIAGDNQFTQANDVQIGYRSTYGSASADHTFDGYIGEVRIALGTLSNDWFATEYAAGNSPGTFVTAGTVEVLSSGASPMIGMSALGINKTALGVY